MKEGGGLAEMQQLQHQSQLPQTRHRSNSRGGGGGVGNGGHAAAAPLPAHHDSGHGAICCAARTIREGVVGYFSKWQGSHGKDPASVPSLRHSFISLLQAALSITVLSFLDTGVHTEQDWMFLVASFGATAVLLYSSHTSPLAQPRNVLVGHFVSSVAGVTVYKIMGAEQPYLAAGFAVGLAIFFMERTNSVHPPGGATALVAVIGSEKVHEAGYLFVVFPCLTGALFMVIISLVCNNLDTHRVYPLYWSKYFPIAEKLFTCAQAVCFPGEAARRAAAQAGAAASVGSQANDLDASSSSSSSSSSEAGADDGDAAEKGRARAGSGAGGMVEIELANRTSPSPPPSELPPGRDDVVSSV